MRQTDQKGKGEVELANAQSIGLGVKATSPDRAERQLVEAAQGGDREAFSELVRLYDRSVLRIAMRILRSPDDAQDAYQDAFLKVYRKLHTFRFQCRFHTWLYRITTNTCLDQLRRRKARREFTTFESGDTPRLSPLDKATDARPSSAPDRVAGSGEISRRVERALDRLSDRERVVFTLRHYEGMRLREIGNACSISEDSAKQCLFRAHKKLRKELLDVRR